jgi:hypothetical protein
VFLPVEPLDGRLCLGVRVHLHEAEPLRAVRIPIDDELRTLHGPELGEQRLQVGLVHVVGQIAHVQLLAHDRTPGRKHEDLQDAFQVEKKGARSEPCRRERRGRGAGAGTVRSSVATRSSDQPTLV